MKIEEFLTYLKTRKNFSAYTIIAYDSDLRQFEELLATQTDGDTSDERISTEIVRLWIMDLADKKISNRSINRKISALKSYFHYLESREELKKNPMSRIVAPKMSKRKMSFIREQDVKSLLEEKYDPEDFEQFRDHLIVELLYCTGMRRSELLGIVSKDISFEGKYIKVTGKRRKERLLPINEKIVQDIIKYMDFKQRLNIEEPHLLVEKDGRIMSVGKLYGIVRKKLQGYDVEKKSPHVFRHTCATHLIDNGAEINNVKNLLGHSSILATEVYVHTTIEQLKKEYKKSFKHI